MKKLVITLIVTLAVSIVAPTSTHALSSLIKGADSDTMYYYDATNNTRHPFPNATTYRSWYGNDFSQVAVVSDMALSDIPLAHNITIRPGTYLVKAQTSPAVYAVEAGGVLRQLLNEDIAQGIYGPRWQERIAAVPDVFFDDYTIGEMIRAKAPVPDNSLYFHTRENQYYYVENGIVRPFASVATVKANNYDTTFAIQGTTDYVARQQPITGFDPLVFNPVMEQAQSTADCEAAELRAAMIMVTRDGVSGAEYDQLIEIKQSLQSWYEWATGDFATIDMSYPLVVAEANAYTVGEEKNGTRAIKNEVLNQFYDHHPDQFDFVFVWTDFATPQPNENELAHYTRVSNHLTGIGLNLNDQGKTYGSNGKLKGIIVMGPLSRHAYERPEGLDRVLHLMTHEIGHQWAGYIAFEGEDGVADYSLLSDTRDHWSYYATMFSPVGGTGWRDNGNGTFTSAFYGNNNINRRQFSQLELYLMGLIPYQFISEPISYLVPDVAGTEGETIYAREVVVDPKSIVDYNGKVTCSISR